MNECIITDYDILGRGIARINNVVVFVSNALLNEIVDVKIIKKNKNFYEGISLNIIKKSEARIKVECPYFFKCGGCDLMHMDLKEELKFKENKVKQTLERSLNSAIKVNPIIYTLDTLNYRNKVTFQVKNDIGFFEKSTNEFLKIDKCLICDFKINKMIKELKLIDLTKVKNIVIRVSKYTGETMVIIDAFCDLDVSMINADSIYLKLNNQYILKKGYEKLTEKMNEYLFKISPSSFFQVNTDIALKLYEKVKEYAALDKNKTLLDLYCGTGTIGIFLSKDAKKVYGIEINEEAIRDANVNKKINAIKNIEFYSLNANQFLKKINEQIDVIVVDPPRGGLDNKTITAILSTNASKIIYVSCNVATLARDLDVLRNNYDILEVTPFNMFPRTCHCESITILERR